MHFGLALFLVAQTPIPAAGLDSAHVVLVATTDVHGRVFAWDGFTMLTAWPATYAGFTDLDAVIADLSVLRQPVDAPTDDRFQQEVR